MTTGIATEAIRDRLVIKTVRDIRTRGQQENSGQGMYRSEIKLDLQRSLLLTESYRETEGEPMVIRRARALERILTRMDLYIQDWERIVGNNVSTPQGLFFGIDMNWRSVRRLVDQDEGRDLLNEEDRRQLDELIEYWRGRSMSDIQQEAFSGEVLEFWRMDRGSPAYWSHWSEPGISQIQFNVVDRETLLDAQKHPEEHSDLLVRVAGYSAYFVDLNKGLQDSIIARTAHTF